jgi:hypothetical protein
MPCRACPPWRAKCICDTFRLPFARAASASLFSIQLSRSAIVTPAKTIAPYSVTRRLSLIHERIMASGVTSGNRSYTSSNSHPPAHEPPRQSTHIVRNPAKNTGRKWPFETGVFTLILQSIFARAYSCTAKLISLRTRTPPCSFFPAPDSTATGANQDY